MTQQLNDTVTKFAITVAFMEMLAQTDFSVMEGHESEVTLSDGRVFVVSVKQVEDCKE